MSPFIAYKDGASVQVIFVCLNQFTTSALLARLVHITFTTSFSLLLV